MAHTHPIAIPAADALLAGTPRLLYGWSIHESNAAPAVATILLRDGTVTGQIVAAIELVADGGSTVSLAHPVYVPGGIFVDVVAGTFEGSIFVS